jgi:tRNA nucleotidyltransferase (CCA-adding enzyme)
MSAPFVLHTHLNGFAAETVNLAREDAKEFREQVNRLREKLERHIESHPDFDLVKILLSGSLAKGTALKTINDIDVAVYLDGNRAPGNEAELLPWLAKKLRESYPQIDPERISPGMHCVRISFSGTELDVDVVPVHYEGDPDDRGYVVVLETGQRVLTSIPLHLKFIRKRKEKQPDHFAQVVRLVKWWVREKKATDQSFKMKSFISEMLIASLADSGTDLSNYPAALEKVFLYIVKSQLKQRVSFSDYYSPSKLPAPTGKPIEIFDPVNPANNVAAEYSDQDRRRIVDAAQEGLERLAEAKHATTKGRAVDCWQDILGSSFQG